MKEIWLIWSGTATLGHRLSTIQGQARIAFLRVNPAVLPCMTVFSFCLFIFEPHWAGEGQWGFSAVVATCCHLGRVPFPRAGLQQGLCTR